MRLNEQEVNAIKESASKIFGDTVQVYLFGSRVDDDKKGGDIESQKRIGEQKIDVVISKDQHRPLEQSVIKHGGTPQCYLPKTEIVDLRKADAFLKPGIKENYKIIKGNKDEISRILVEDGFNESS